MMLDYYELGPIVAVEWSPTMAEKFPNAEHHGCRQLMLHNNSGHWQPYNPPRCHGYHCPQCGAACGQYGHRNCTEAVQ